MTSESFPSRLQLPRIGLNLLSVELCLALDVLQVHNRLSLSARHLISQCILRAFQILVDVMSDKAIGIKRQHLLSVLLVIAILQVQNMIVYLCICTCF